MVSERSIKPGPGPNRDKLHHDIFKLFLELQASAITTIVCATLALVLNREHETAVKLMTFLTAVGTPVFAYQLIKLIALVDKTGQIPQAEKPTYNRQAYEIFPDLELAQVINKRLLSAIIENGQNLALPAFFPSNAPEMIVQEDDGSEINKLIEARVGLLSQAVVTIISQSERKVETSFLDRVHIFKQLRLVVGSKDLQRGWYLTECELMMVGWLIAANSMIERSPEVLTLMLEPIVATIESHLSSLILEGKTTDASVYLFDSCLNSILPIASRPIPEVKVAVAEAIERIKTLMAVGRKKGDKEEELIQIQTVLDLVKGFDAVQISRIIKDMQPEVCLERKEIVATCSIKNDHDLGWPRTIYHWLSALSMRFPFLETIKLNFFGSEYQFEIPSVLEHVMTNGFSPEVLPRWSFLSSQDAKRQIAGTGQVS